MAVNAAPSPPTKPARSRLNAKVFLSLAALFVVAASSLAAICYRHGQAIATAYRTADSLDLIAAVGLVVGGVGLAFVLAAVLIDREIRARTAAEQQLRQSQKLEAVGQLTRGVAHDFNNILTVIIGTIEILEDNVGDRPELAAMARLIGEAAERASELTDQLLAFARMQPLQPRPTDLNALVANAEKLLRPALGERVEFKSILAREAWLAMVDAPQLSAALLNLAINSRDAMSAGGQLTLETANVILDEAYAKANGEVTPGPYVMIAVSDTGTGIPAAIIDRVFEPFFTTKAIGQGTGLGLAMVYGFIKQSNGHIKICSEEGHGTTIKIYLPRAAAPAGQLARIDRMALDSPSAHARDADGRADEMVE